MKMDVLFIFFFFGAYKLHHMNNLSAIFNCDKNKLTVIFVDFVFVSRF